MTQSSFVHSCVVTLLLTLGPAAAALDQNGIPAKPKCDPTMQSCAPGFEQTECKATQCLATLAEQAKFEKDNNCKFQECSDSVTEVPIAVLRQIFTSASITTESLAAIVQELNNALKNKTIQTLINTLINTKRKLAHFLAQVKQEVGPRMRLTENLNYIPEIMKVKFSYFGRHPQEAELFGRTKDHPADQEAIANRAYANRNGNGDVASGDGWAYRGRGMIQLTGKSNYKSFTAEHNKIWLNDIKDFVKDPGLITQETYAARSALIFWKTHNLASIASKGISYDESLKITKVINSGTDEESKRARYKNLEDIMKLEFFKECNR